MLTKDLVCYNFTRFGDKSISFFRAYLVTAFRTKVRGDFNIHGTKYFQNAVFHQKSKNYAVSLLYLWLAKKPVLYMKYWHGWLLLKMREKAFSVIRMLKSPLTSVLK